MQKFLDKMEALRSDANGINSIKGLASLYIDFISNPDQVATLLANRNDDLNVTGKELIEALTSKLSRDIAIEKGKDAILNLMHAKIDTFKWDYIYVDEEIEYLEDTIEQSYKLVGLANQQDLFTRKAEYNANALAKEYILKKGSEVLASKISLSGDTTQSAQQFISKLVTVMNKVGSVSISEVEEAVIRHKNNHEMLVKDFDVYIANKTIPSVTLETDEPNEVDVLVSEKDFIPYISQQTFEERSFVESLDALIDAVPEASRRIYSIANDFKEYIDKVDLPKDKFVKYGDMFTDLLKFYQENAVTPEELVNSCSVYCNMLNNLIVSDNNLINVLRRYNRIITNHIVLFVYIGKLLDLILVSGLIVKDGDKNPYAAKKARKEELAKQLGELNTIELLKQEGKEVPVDGTPATEDLSTSILDLLESGRSRNKVVTPKNIKVIEEALGTKLPSELIEYLTKYGYLACDHMELYGASDDNLETSDLVKQTLYLRNDMNVRKDLIAIEWVGESEYRLIDKNNIVWVANFETNKLVSTGKKLFKYIEDTVKEIRSFKDKRDGYTAEDIEPITEKELAETERKIGMKLPKDFREFILKCNGGYFVNQRIGNEVAERISDYRLVPWRENSSDIKILWEIKLLNEYIEEENSENRNKFKLKVNTCLPVGDNGFGDMYFITTDTKKVYLMNHETGNATLIANSFTEFYKKLEPLDD